MTLICYLHLIYVIDMYMLLYIYVSVYMHTPFVGEALGKQTLMLKKNAAFRKSLQYKKTKQTLKSTFIF